MPRLQQLTALIPPGAQCRSSSRRRATAISPTRCAAGPRQALLLGHHKRPWCRTWNCFLHTYRRSTYCFSRGANSLARMIDCATRAFRQVSWRLIRSTQPECECASLRRRSTYVRRPRLARVVNASEEKTRNQILDGRTDARPPRLYVTTHRLRIPPRPPTEPQPPPLPLPLRQDACSTWHLQESPPRASRDVVNFKLFFEPTCARRAPPGGRRRPPGRGTIWKNRRRHVRVFFTSFSSLEVN